MKVYLRTYGCRANQYDSEQVRALVEGAGGVIVDDPSEADSAVFNSCAVTAEAEAELRKGIRGVARTNASLRTVVMGCAAALDRGQIAALPTVADVVPGGDAFGVVSALGLEPQARHPRDGPARDAGAAAHPGGVRRALHLLRDDHGSRRQSLATRR